MDFPVNSHDEKLNETLRRLNSAECILEEWISYAIVLVKYQDILILGKRLSKYKSISSQIAKEFLFVKDKDVLQNHVLRTWEVYPSQDHKEVKRQVHKVLADLPYVVLAGAFTSQAVLLSTTFWGNIPRKEIDVYCNDTFISTI